jgi:hypothetical protein
MHALAIATQTCPVVIVEESLFSQHQGMLRLYIRQGA